MMQKEIDQLRYQVEHHPDVTRFATENLDLRGIRSYRKFNNHYQQLLYEEFLRFLKRFMQPMSYS